MYLHYHWIKKLSIKYPELRIGLKHKNYISDTESIGALCVSSCSSYFAVGSSNDGGSLCILNANTGTYASILSDNVKGGVISAAFSHDSKYIAVLGGDDRHTVYLYGASNSWNDSSLIWSGETSKADCKFITFHSEV